jgi:hypothetical protein
LYAAIGVTVLAVVVALNAMRDDERASRAAAPRRGGQAAAAEQAVAVDDVKLELLRDKRGDLAEAERNPFRFQARQAPPRTRSESSGPIAPGPVEVAPPVPQ